jgi:hypothetical protein
MATSLDQLGQGYISPPATGQFGQPQLWGANLIRQAQGPWQGGYAGAPGAATGYGDAAQGTPGAAAIYPPASISGQPANPPASAASPDAANDLGSILSGAPASTMPAAQPPPSPPASIQQPPPNPPATGGPLNYWSQRPMNSAGFGGLGTMYGGQRPGLGARYWARLNNIGGT